MDIDETTRRPRAARAAAGLLAALLALTASLVAGTTAPAGAADPPTTGLVWKMSEQAWTSSSLAPAHATTAPATKEANGFTFPTASATAFDPATGAGTATFAGSFEIGNINQGNYRIRITNPTVVLDAGGTDGRITADVSYALTPPAGEGHTYTTPARTTVADLTFAAGAIVDTGRHVSFTVTPDFVLRTDLEENPNEFRQFPQPFLDVLAPAVPSLLGHFRQTGANQAGKAPSPVTVGFPYTPAPPTSGLIWKVSDQAWTSSSLAPAHAAGDPAYKTTGGFAFPEATSGVYDPATGEGEIAFTGWLEVGNFAQGNYRIRMADPTLHLDGERGTLTADVSYALTPAAGQDHVYTAPVRTTVADLTIPAGAVTIADGALSLTVTPDFVLRTDLEENPNEFRQFPQPFLDVLAPAVPSLLGHFRQTGANQAGKAPAPLTVAAVPVDVVEPPDPDEAFVEHLFQAALGRAVDEGALEFWVGRLDAGASRQSVANSVTGSAEGRTRLVRTLYPTTVGRSASAAEVSYWGGRVAAGMSAEDLVLNLLGSPEAFTRWGGDGEGLAEAAYQHHLGRAGDTSGVAFWAGRLDTAGSSAGRKSVLRSFGRAAEATTIAVNRSASSACASTPAIPSADRTALTNAWVQTGRNAVRLTGTALVRLCPEGNIL